MRLCHYFFLAVIFSGSDCCFNSEVQNTIAKPVQPIAAIPKKYVSNSWQYFLQHLTIVDGPILDYKGQPVTYQEKHVGIIPYDVGKVDLQQCADALIRLRAEYLFEQKRYGEIGFHFVSGDYYSWNDYSKGLRPLVQANKIRFITSSTSEKNHESLRRYLDIVYSYASTISLAKELKPTNDFEIGTVVIHAGSPGHCFIIIDEAINKAGDKVYKLAEGYTPAQSIYVLRNLNEAGMSPWYELKKGVIETASYKFENYKLVKFE